MERETAQEQAALRRREGASKGGDGTANTPVAQHDVRMLGNANLHALLGDGESLSGDARAGFERGFGSDLSDVRVHTGARADSVAQVAGAVAFTVGADIVFGRGAYEPESAVGRRVLAHEIAHTLQQRGAPAAHTPLAVSAPADASERQADTMADAALCGAPVPAPATVAQHVARAPVRAAVVKTRTAFQAEVARRFAIADVHAGTLEEQREYLSRGGQTPTAEFDKKWKSWDPGAASDTYQAIIDGIAAFAAKFGGVPPVKQIIFFRMSYELDEKGVAVAEPGTGAAYGSGVLAFYERGAGKDDAYRLHLPTERSNSTGDYAPSGGTVFVPGETLGAPVRPSTQHESAAAVVGHELGHGLAEVAMRGEKPPDGPMIADYSKEVGWFGTGSAQALYDIGVPAVADAIKAGNAPPSANKITGPGWNDPALTEQPMSRYMVEGGPSEDFAEAVRAYVAAPAVLKARSPHRFGFLETRKTLWTSHLTATKR